MKKLFYILANLGRLKYWSYIFIIYSCSSVNKEILPITNSITVLSPSNLKGTISSASINLSWADNSNNESGFSVERKNVSNSGNFETIGKVATNQSNYEDKNVNLTNVLHYRVKAFLENGLSSDYSNIYIQEPQVTNIQIGTQLWGMKNLDVTSYRDGTPIPQVSDPKKWEELTTGAWCYYNNDSLNNNVSGKLYNWYAVAGIFDESSKTDLSKRKQLSPIGSIPTDDELLELKFTLNSSGQNFNFIYGGFRNTDGTYNGFGSRYYYWSSSEQGADAAWSRTNSGSNVLSGDLVYKKMGLTVRYLEKKNTSSINSNLPEWTLIPDINFEKSLITQGLDNIQDGKVLTSNISSLKLFRMEHARVKDMTGLESFVSVENLFLWDNDFTKINLSQNTKLKILGLSECPLSSIDLSNNTELVEIDFQHNSTRGNDPTYAFGKTTGFTSLDLSKNTKLERIYVWMNRLTALDVSMCPNLTDLWLSGGYGDRRSGNPIESIDLSKNPKFNVLVASDCNLKYLNIKGTANNGVPRTCITKGNASLNEIKVNNINAINSWRETAAGADGTLVKNGWYLKDDHTKYVE